MKIRIAAIVVTMALSTAQPALAGGGYHHHGGRGSGWGWAPFVAGAVVGGLAINAWAQPRPIYPAPLYIAPPPPRVIVAQPYYAVPAPVYEVPQPPPAYYYERD